MIGNTKVFLFLLTAPGLGHGQGHGQDLILPLTTGRRTIKEAIKIIAITGATSAARGGHSTSGAEDAAFFLADTTSAGAAATTIITSDPTGRITSRTLKKSSSSTTTTTSSSNSSSSRTTHKDDLRITRAAQEAPLVMPLTTQIDPPRRCPDTRGILRPPPTTPPPNSGKTACRSAKTPKM